MEKNITKDRDLLIICLGKFIPLSCAVNKKDVLLVRRATLMDSVVFRTIFVSDTHLGTRHAQAELFLHFLRNTESQYLYLVGDIIDLWKLKSGWYWPPIKNDIVRIILDKARKGTRAIYVPGNDDERSRDYVGTIFNGIHILQHAVHETADGRRLLVMHGDEFDSVILHSRWLA